MSNLRKSSRYAEVVLVAALVALALLARWAGGHVITDDMRIFFQWYNQLKRHGLGTEIGNYNAPFLYLLAILIYLPGSVLFKIKAAFMVFDVVLAFYTYKIVGLRWPGRRIPVAAALMMVLLPTVVINASLYGQMDSMWAAFAVGGVYYLLRDKPWHAVAFCTIALAVKPQGIFVFPVLLLLALAGRLPWRTLLAAPAVFVALDLPAILAGRDPIELLTIYDMGRQARHVPGLSLRAPSLYAFVPPGGPTDAIRLLGYVFTAAIVLGICWVLIARAVELTRERVVLVATLFALLLPFLLPGMHERYFFLADAMTLILAVFRPRLWFVPLIVQAASLLAYGHYLIGNSPLPPMTVAATMMLAALLVLGHALLREAFAEVTPEPVAESLDAEWAALNEPEAVSPPAATPEPLPVRPA